MKLGDEWSDSQFTVLGLPHYRLIVRLFSHEGESWIVLVLDCGTYLTVPPSREHLQFLLLASFKTATCMVSRWGCWSLERLLRLLTFRRRRRGTSVLLGFQFAALLEIGKDNCLSRGIKWLSFCSPVGKFNFLQLCPFGVLIRCQAALSCDLSVC